jgi:hypothetical protein
VFFRGLYREITLTLLAGSERFPSNFRAGVADYFSAPTRPSRGGSGSFFRTVANPIGSNQGQCFFRGLYREITLTLLADSERLPSEFRAGVTDFFATPS